MNEKEFLEIDEEKMKEYNDNTVEELWKRIIPECNKRIKIMRDEVRNNKLSTTIGISDKDER